MSEETAAAAAAAPLSPLKRAFLAVQSLQGKLDELQAAKNEPIAVIGLSCRFPGAENPERYWELLAAGMDAVSERPAGRWPKEMLDDDDVVGEQGSRWGGFLSTVDTFDPLFFSLAPREAAGMDPQQRLFLEVCWEALENAGIAADKLNGHPTGVFAGACTNDYWNLQLRGGDLAAVGTHFASGIAHSIITGRISYLLGLTGPSISIDTACSSSLTAIHLACQAIRNGECDMALAGGVSTILLPDIAVAYARSGMAAADGRCKVFDASADGFVRGEGCGVVVLKRLSKAIADGDIIHALIRGSALNQDGASSSMTAPSGPAQEAVIRSALKAAGLKPGDVGYVEAHGTGTVLGDPIELQAIGAALGPGRAPGDDVLVGSVKSNFGHLEASAGVAGLIKIILSMQHGAIPASLHFKTPNPMIPWDQLPVRVPTALTPWKAPAGSRVAGISGFGFSGTNAHLIVSDAPVAQPVSADHETGRERPTHLIALSAPTETGLRAVAAQLAAHVASHPEQSIADIAHTTNVGRAHFRNRATFVVDPRADVAARLRGFAAGEEQLGVTHGQIQSTDGPRILFLFSGQGSQYVDMGRRLYETQPTFRRAIEECDELLWTELEPRALQVLYPSAGQSSRIDETAYTQPVMFALEYALAMMWQSWGIRPSAVMGHSLGEFVAATIAGVLPLEDALRLVAVRGWLGQKLPRGGSMAAVLADVKHVRSVLASLGDVVTIAAINAPENNVISGPDAAMDAAIARFTAQGIEVKRLPISNAFHAPAIEPMLAEFESVASTSSYGVQKLPVYSNLFGRRAVVGEMSNAKYWTRHLREPVQFAAGFAAAVSEGFSTFLEVGPHTTLVGLGRQSFPDSAGLWLPTLRRGYDDWEILLGSLAKLHVAGAPVDWVGFDRDYKRRRVVLPTYPFERQRYWFPQTAVRATRAQREEVLHPLLERRIKSPFVQDTIFETNLSLTSLPWLGDHRVLGAAVLPATAHLEAAWSAAALVYGDSVTSIEDIDIHDALVTPEAAARTMQLAISPAEGDSARFRIMSSDDMDAVGEGAWRAHVSGSVSLKPGPRAASLGDIAGIRARCAVSISSARLYDAVSQRGIALGSRFRGVVELYQGKSEALGRLHAPEEVASELAPYHIHPALLDSALHVVTAALFDEANLASPGETYMPIAVEHFRILQRAGADLWSHAVARPRKANESPVVDVRIYDAVGTAVAEVVGLQFRRVEAAAWANASTARVDDQLYEVEWTPIAAAELPSVAKATWNAPAPSEIVGALSSGVNEMVKHNRLDRYNQHLPDLDVVCRDLIVEALRSLGWTPRPGARENERELGDRLGVVKQHRRLFNRLLAILAEDGILSRDGNDWLVEKSLDAAPTAVRLTALRATFLEGAGELGILASTGPQLAACLAGRVDPLSLLFPGGSFDAADELYRRSPPALMANALARKAVERFVVASPSGAPIRVLEIGAGTGGTTSFVLPAFPPDRTKYTFTDLSPLFLARAEERMIEYPFLDYRILDIERDPAAQQFEPNGFDLVIAANVLHATRDLRETLAHARRLVRPGGLLLLIESTRPQRWIDLTFGLTDGWWRFTDEALRPNYPLIDRHAWSAALTAAGFELPAAIPGEGGNDAIDQNLVIMARAPQAAREKWIVFADAGGVGDSIAAELRLSGRDVVRVRSGARFERDGANYVLPSTDRSAYAQLIDEVSGDGKQAIAGMVHAWALDLTPGDTSSIADLHAANDVGCRSALHLTQAAATNEHAGSARLVLVTRGAQAVRRDDVTAPVHATVWGLANTIRLEHPDLDCLCVDLDPNASALVDNLLATILSTKEPQLAVRDGAWRAARLIRYTHVASTPVLSDQRVDLVNTTPGVLDGLAFVAAQRPTLGADDVEIRVTASALNFRDVLIAMALYPGASATDRLGGECAGEVVAIGSSVTRFAVGDSVVAMAAGGLSSHAVAHAEHVMLLPDGMTREAAVTVPSVFVTAWHSLYDLAELKRGDRVLIHAGAGGVGLSAIQLAKRVGAEVFATAGSEAKRAFLLSIGVDHVMDSRSVSYVDEIAAITGGKGVDVVLNSLADQHIAASFSVLGDGGRFVELGKRGIWSNERVAQEKPTVRYFVVDLAAVGVARPEVVGDVLRSVREALVAGEIQPLLRTAYASGDVAAAFRYMAQAKHIGKIVVTRAHVSNATAVRADGTYLITGGLGGLGLVVAERLVERGAGHVMLMSRGEPDEKTRALINVWNMNGTRVSVVRGDVARDEDVERAISLVDKQRPLRGIIHSAGVLRDGILVGQEWANFATTFGPKLDGTWNLHRHSLHAPLDFFVLFSSISSLFGSAGQGNHAAANAFMDALAHYRRSRGLPALSINWGAWADVGAALERGVAQRIGAQGMGTIAPKTGVDMLQRLLEDNPAQAAAMPVDWNQFARQFAGGRLRSSFLATLAQASEKSSSSQRSAPTATAPREPATPLRDAPTTVRWELLLERMRKLASRVLGLDSALTLDANRPLQEMGLDSLMAVELRNVMKTDLGLERPIAATIVFDHPTLHALTEYVGGNMLGWASRTAAQPATVEADEIDLLDQIESLSPAEIDQLLAKRMGQGD